MHVPHCEILHSRTEPVYEDSGHCMCGEGQEGVNTTTKYARRRLIPQKTPKVVTHFDLCERQSYTYYAGYD